MLGLNWCWKSGKRLYKQHRQKKQKLHIHKIQRAITNEIRTAEKSAVGISTIFPETHTEHYANCGCGHQHIPDPDTLNQNVNIKESVLIILSIGMRPCSGAIFVLFLAYMLDLFAWGMAATLAMSLGTGITLSAFALLVRYARSTAIKIGQWYRRPFADIDIEAVAKCLAGIILIFFALALIYGTTLPVSGGATLFAR